MCMVMEERRAYNRRHVKMLPYIGGFAPCGIHLHQIDSDFQKSVKIIEMGFYKWKPKFWCPALTFEGYETICTSVSSQSWYLSQV